MAPPAASRGPRVASRWRASALLKHTRSTRLAGEPARGLQREHRLARAGRTGHTQTPVVQAPSKDAKLLSGETIDGGGLRADARAKRFDKVQARVEHLTAEAREVGRRERCWSHRLRGLPPERDGALDPPRDVREVIRQQDDLARRLERQTTIDHPGEREPDGVPVDEGEPFGEDPPHALAELADQCLHLLLRLREGILHRLFAAVAPRTQPAPFARAPDSFALALEDEQPSFAVQQQKVDLALASVLVLQDVEPVIHEPAVAETVLQRLVERALRATTRSRARSHSGDHVGHGSAGGHAPRFHIKRIS